MVTKGGISENIGRINNINVRFEAVYSYKPTKKFITADKSESVQAPSEKIVLTTDSFWEE